MPAITVVYSWCNYFVTYSSMMSKTSSVLVNLSGAIDVLELITLLNTSSVSVEVETAAGSLGSIDLACSAYGIKFIHSQKEIKNMELI